MMVKCWFESVGKAVAKYRLNIVPVKINKSGDEEPTDEAKTGETEELAFMIDKAIDNFFDNHVLKFYALGRNISMPRNGKFIAR